MSSVVSIADRDRPASAIANAALQDLSAILKEVKNNEIDRMKSKIATSTNERDLIEDSRHEQVTKNRGLIFDGRKKIKKFKKRK